MNYMLNILLILFIKFYSIENYNKNLLGVWNLISKVEIIDGQTDKENESIINYKIGEKVMELKSNNTIIEYQGRDLKELKNKISKKNINIFEENGSSIELIYYLINDTLVIENYDQNKMTVNWDIDKNKFEDSPAKRKEKSKSSQLYVPRFDDEQNSSFVVDSWYKKSFWLYLLYPFSLIVSYITARRRRKYLKGASETHKSEVPVIVVGNLTIGGTGKTPLVKYIASELLSLGYKPGLVSRGYGGKFKETLLVSDQTPVKQTGDEAQILATLNLPFYIDKSRVRAVKAITDNHDCDIIISDDGLQHYKMNRDIEIVVIDGKRRFGNNLTFPAGPLRESKARLNSVDFIVNNSGPTDEGEYLMNVSPSRFVHLKSGKSYPIEDWPMHKQVHAVAGLGNPGRFFDLLARLGFDIIRHPFQDHHNFHEQDIHYLDHLPIVMTEKDASKCKDFNNNKIWYLTIEADVSDKFINELDTKIKSIN